MVRTFFIILSFLPVLAGCRGNCPAKPYMAAAPDYADTSMWYIAGAGTETGADVFYILPTCVRDWTDSSGRTSHFADVRNPGHIAALMPSNILADSIFGEFADFYSPYYRQITLDSWESEETAESRFPYAMEDVFRAFEYYMEHWNGGRPFFIAGFSQGAKCTLELLKSLDAEERERLIAAYVVGYKVTEDDLRNVNVRPAEGPADCGVTVCYNSVESPECASQGIAASEICINPLNWSCGPEPAVVRDTVEISVDTAANVLVVKGLDSDRYYHPSLAELFVKGNYHLLELELYADALRENVRVRAESFFAGKR